MQVLVYEAYADGTKCYNLTDVPVRFLDGGMDRAATCGQNNGGCLFTYSFDPQANSTDRGIGFGPFQGGDPNLSQVKQALKGGGGGGGGNNGAVAFGGGGGGQVLKGNLNSSFNILYSVTVGSGGQGGSSNSSVAQNGLNSSIISSLSI
jgi:hypothetical protein